MKNMSLEEMVQLLDSMLMIEAKMDDRPRFPLPPGSPPRKLENAEISARSANSSAALRVRDRTNVAILGGSCQWRRG
jgi:hypothetical protein